MLSRTAARGGAVAIHIVRDSIPSPGPAASRHARHFTGMWWFDDPLPDQAQSQEFVRLHSPPAISFVERFLKFPYRQIRQDKGKWLEALVQLRQSVEVGSPKDGMSPELSLALLLDLKEAGRQNGAEVNCDDFAMLFMALTSLQRLNFTSADREHIDRFAFSCVDAAAELLPSWGLDFVAAPPEKRREWINRFIGRLASDACAHGLGLREQDKLALQRQPVEFNLARSPLSAAFGRNAAGEYHISFTSSLLHADRSGLTGDEFTEDDLMADFIGTASHEILHACQSSYLSTQCPSLEHFPRRQALAMSFAADLRLRRSVLSILGEKAYLEYMYPHEMPAYYLSLKVLEAIANSPRMDACMRAAAGRLLEDSRSRRMALDLTGSEIKPVPRDAVDSLLRSPWVEL